MADDAQYDAYALVVVVVVVVAMVMAMSMVVLAMALATARAMAMAIAMATDMAIAMAVAMAMTMTMAAVVMVMQPLKQQCLKSRGQQRSTASTETPVWRSRRYAPLWPGGPLLNATRMPCQIQRKRPATLCLECSPSSGRQQLVEGCVSR